MKRLACLTALVIVLVGCETKNPTAPPPPQYVIQFAVQGPTGPFSVSQWQATVSDAPDSAHPQGNTTSFSAPVSLPWISAPVTVGGGAWGMEVCQPNVACNMVVIDNGVTLINRTVPFTPCQTADGSVN